MTEQNGSSNKKTGLYRKPSSRKSEEESGVHKERRKHANQKKPNTGYKNNGKREERRTREETQKPGAPGKQGTGRHKTGGRAERRTREVQEQGRRGVDTGDEGKKERGRCKQEGATVISKSARAGRQRRRTAPGRTTERETGCQQGNAETEARR